MKLLLIDVVKIHSAISQIAKLDTLDARESYGVAKILMAVERDYIYAYNQQDVLAAKHGAGTPEYHAEFSDLMLSDAGEFDLSPVLLRGDIIGIRAQDIAALGKLIVIEGTQDAPEPMQG